MSQAAKSGKKRKREGGDGSKGERKDEKRGFLRDIAAGTLDAIKHGSYLQHDLAASVTSSKQNTKYYAPNSLLSSWASVRPDATHDTRVSLLEVSTLEGARLLANVNPDVGSPKIGLLNFASAKKPGGGFINGAQAQEESIARSSTLYPTLMTATAQQFYTLHNRDAKGGYYSHAMIYSPGVIILRDDQGGWTDPLKVDVLTSPAVNAGVVRRHPRAKESDIADVMKERMGRLLFLFERQGMTDLVLGSFGTGVFRNDVETVARLWTELLLAPDARFRQSFSNIVFAVLGTQTFNKFQEVFSPYNIL